MDLLGGGQIFAITRINQEVRPGVLGPAVLFAPAVTFEQAVSPSLHGPAQLFSPTISGEFVGPVARLGPATLFAPSVARGFTFNAEAEITRPVRMRHNRYTEHSGFDFDFHHLLYATINDLYLKGFPVDELIREIDRRLTIVETGGSQVRRVFQSLTTDAVIKKESAFTFTANATIIKGVQPPPLGPAVVFAPTLPLTLSIPMLGPAQLFEPEDIFEP
jgi:hypothetical protein